MNRWLILLFSFLLLISGCTINIENSSPNEKEEVIQLEKKQKEEANSEVETKPKENTESSTPSAPSNTPTPDNNANIQSNEQTPSYSSGNKYNVFSGSYTNPTNAFTKVNTLKNHQISSAVVEAYVHGRKWYRVYVGSFDDKTSAQQYLHSLTQKGFTDTFIVYESPPTTHVTPSSPTQSVQEQEEPVQYTTEKKYSVYSGSFENYANAQARVELLQQKQINSTIMEAYVHGRKWYRVHVGSFYDKASAQQLLDSFKSQGFNDTFMIYE
jgi:cell division protein FtsN